MKYETKLNLGQLCWYVQSFDSRRLIKCRTCSEVGTIKIGEDTFVCPKCQGRSSHAEYAGQRWIVDWQEATVGQIRIEHTDYHYLYQNETGELPEITYMISSHGVRSGMIIKEADLFATKEGAEAECARRNLGKVWTDEEGVEQRIPLIS